MFPQMGDFADKAHKDERGYTCPLCGKEGLAGTEMAGAWSAADWSYIAVWCQECQRDPDRRYHQAAGAEPEPSMA